MKLENLLITEISNSDESLISKFISKLWGSVFIVSRGKQINVLSLPGYICKRDNKILGLITYNIKNYECEVVTLDSKISNIGLGTKLLNKVIEKAKEENCRRVWLVTSNDNINAIEFYQKRGFELSAFYKNAIRDSRKIKPEIPEYGYNNIPIKHEIEFEILLNK